MYASPAPVPLILAGLRVSNSELKLRLVGFIN